MVEVHTQDIFTLLHTDPTVCTLHFSQGMNMNHSRDIFTLDRDNREVFNSFMTKFILAEMAQIASKNFVNSLGN